MYTICILTEHGPPMTQRFQFLLLDDFTLLSFASAVEPLRIANMLSGQDLYQWRYASEDGKRATASNGTDVAVHDPIAQIPASDYLFVISGIHPLGQATAVTKSALRLARSRGVTLGGLCSGTYALAETGILDGQKAAIHWEYHEAIREKYPQITLAEGVFVADCPVLSASGGTACADLMLHLIGQEHGEDLSLAVSEQMVYTAVREGSADQRIPLLVKHASRNQRLAQAIRIMRQHIEQPLATNEVAETIGVSTRQLERLFAQHLQTSPKRFMMDLRLARARTLLVHTDMSIVEIALACGFVSPSHFSRVYQKAFGTRPNRQRRHLS